MAKRFLIKFGDNIVRLYDFDRSQADQFRQIVKQTIIDNKKELDLSTVDFIEERNCNLAGKIIITANKFTSLS